MTLERAETQFGKVDHQVNERSPLVTQQPRKQLEMSGESCAERMVPAACIAPAVGGAVGGTMAAMSCPVVATVFASIGACVACGAMMCCCNNKTQDNLSNG